MKLRSIKELPLENKIVYFDNRLSHSKEIYGIYSKEADITMILEDIIQNDTKKCISTEVKGFYYGMPEIALIKKYNGELKAEF